MPIPLSEASPRKLSGYLLQNFHWHQVSYAARGSAGCETLLQDDCRASCSLVFSGEIVGINGKKKKKNRRCLQNSQPAAQRCFPIANSPAWHGKAACTQTVQRGETKQMWPALFLEWIRRSQAAPEACCRMTNGLGSSEPVCQVSGDGKSRFTTHKVRCRGLQAKC